MEQVVAIAPRLRGVGSRFFNSTSNSDGAVGADDVTQHVEEPRYRLAQLRLTNEMLIVYRGYVVERGSSFMIEEAPPGHSPYIPYGIFLAEFRA